MPENLWNETMAADWDLCAVVKSFSTTLAKNNNYNNNTTPEEDHPIPQGLASLVSQQNDVFPFPSNMASFGELHEACNAFVPFSQQPINPNITTTSSTNIFSILPQPLKKPRPYYYRKKKTQPSKVVEVAAENLQGVDRWCWRKYGQKPIKGTPHPRSYYKCSSDNNKCPARKHVERSQTDPNVFIVSYEGDHTHSLPIHRNPLSGSTRIRQWGSGSGSSSSPSIVTTTTTTSTSSSSATTLSPLPESSMDVKRDGKEDEEVEMISNLVLAEDILMGFRELGGN